MEVLIFKGYFYDVHIPTSVYRFFHVLFRGRTHSFPSSLSPVFSWDRQSLGWAYWSPPTVTNSYVTRTICFKILTLCLRISFQILQNSCCKPWGFGWACIRGLILGGGVGLDTSTVWKYIPSSGAWNGNRCFVFWPIARGVGNLQP